MSDTGDDHMPRPVAAPARRIEVFTGAGWWRVWSKEDKAAIIAESYAGTDTVSGVARQHGLATSQLFGWRRKVPRAGKTPVLAFVPAVIEALPLPVVVGKWDRRRNRRSAGVAGMIEVEIDGVVVRAGRGANIKMVAAVIRALKAAT